MIGVGNVGGILISILVFWVGGAEIEALEILGVLPILYVVAVDEQCSAQQGLVAGVPAMLPGIKDAVVIGVITTVGADVEEVVVFLPVIQRVAAGILGVSRAQLIPGLHRQENGTDICLFRRLQEFVNDGIRGPGTAAQNLLQLLMGDAVVPGQKFKGNAGAVHQIGAGVHIESHRLLGGIVPIQLGLFPDAVVIGAGYCGAQSGAIGSMNEADAQGGLHLQRLIPF